MPHDEASPPLILTIGHSTRSLEEFVNLLKTHGGEQIVDVRTVPRSARNPQYNRDTLPDSLGEAGIGYTHMPGLGGLRHPRPESLNVGWRNLSFRGFADYMQTPEFESNLEVLVELAGRKRIVLMCAETVPWRCHRSLISDALVARGFPVEHILDERKRQVHALKPWAVVDGFRVSYPIEQWDEDEATTGTLDLG